MSDRTQSREEMLNIRGETDKLGFRDKYGYILEFKDNEPESKGEAVLFTAIAVIALAVGNYNPDDWDKKNANNYLTELLTTLKDQSWGNMDSLGRVHPIRHPDMTEYDIEGNPFRKSPLSKDSFNAIVAAAYYAYTCPNSNQEVRQLARDLITKWTEYLVLFQWRTHSNYIEGEFIPDDSRKNYRYIFSSPEKGDVSYKGPETFMLLPHEIYALQNVASALGVPVNWYIWESEMTAEMKQMIIDNTAPFIAATVANGFNYILSLIPTVKRKHEVHVGPTDWVYGNIIDIIEIKITNELKETISKNVYDTILLEIKESIRLNTYMKYQRDGLRAIVINRILNLFPDQLGTESWRSVITSACQEIMPWLSGDGWIEIASFLMANAMLVTLDTSTKSYTVWSFASELETRVEMRTVLSPGIQAFYQQLKKENNPNGIWAWITMDGEELNRQLSLFKSKDPRYWWKFAYMATPFNEWVSEPEKKEPDGRSSSRLDYIIIDRLSEKGSPIQYKYPNDWLDELGKYLLSDSAKKIENGIKKQLADTGQVVRNSINQFGEYVKETWNAAGTLVSELYKDSALTAETLISRNIQELNGKLVREYWNTQTSKYFKMVEFEKKLIEKIDINLQNVMTKEYWNRANQKYWKAVWKTPIAVVGNLLERFVLATNDIWTEEYWNRANEKYWKGVWKNSITDGTSEMIERIKTNMDGTKIKEYWNRTNEKYAREIWSNVSGTYKKMEKYIQKMDGIIEIEKWDEAGKWGKRTFDSTGKLLETNGELAPLILIPGSSIIPSRPSINIHNFGL